eukprot:1340845-Alexandrium_andersonii.AAC.1
MRPRRCAATRHPRRSVSGAWPRRPLPRAHAPISRVAAWWWAPRAQTPPASVGRSLPRGGRPV